MAAAGDCVDLSKVLNRLLWQATVDSQFREALLNGQRATLLARFQFDADVRLALLAIQARTLPEFAAGVVRLVAAESARARATLAPAEAAECRRAIAGLLWSPVEPRPRAVREAGGPPAR